MAYVKALSLGVTAALVCATGTMAQGINGSLRARVTYDDATARSTDAVAAARGLKQSDVIGDILATFDIKREFGRQEAYASGGIGYDFHRENTQLDRERIDVQGGVRRDVGPCGVDLGGTYARSQTDLEDLEFEPVKNTTERTMVRTSVSCRRLIGIAPTLEVSKSWSDNSATARQLANSDTLTINGGLAYFRPALGSVTVYAEYRETDFPNRLVLVGGQVMQDGYESVSGGVRYNRRIGARLGGSLFVAYNSLNPDIPGVEGYEGLTYGGGLNYRASSRLNTNFSFTRDTQPSNRLDSTYSLSESYTLGATYALGARMSLSLTGTHRTREMEGTGLIPGFDITDEETNLVTGSLSMKLNRRIALSLDASHQERTADVAGFDYESQRVGLTATAGF